jgi:hypothetical protein
MQEPNGLNHEQRELESALRCLSPAAAKIDPITAAFTAGRRSSRRQLHLWRSATVLILLVGAASRLMPPERNAAVQPRDFSENKIAIRSEQPPPEAPAPQSVRVLQETMREKGPDGLPSANVPSVQIISIGNLF